MKHLAIALLALASLVSAKPAFLSLPLTYESLTSGGQLAAHSGALDNPEVNGRTQRVLDDRVNLAVNEVPRSQVPALRLSSSHVNNGPSSFTSPAPLGADGRVVDTAEVAAAKAAHAAAHANERLNLANEAARSEAADASDSSEVADNSPAAADGGIPDAPEVAGARVNEKINLAGEAVRPSDALTRIADANGAVVPLVLDNGVVVAAALVPLDPAGRLSDSTQLPVNGNRKSVV
ncbi:uncharacterized protein LOC116849738 [Odontomachus brunneus]|uniref:uncharacterized protein LOC116849738 n=1 Tax=Odontomachus brunneus TaxID=486640 RepID=UPI0013F2678A|nr:uncharacterized protein LOC116849738 [Odontomachus brunneus]